MIGLLSFLLGAVIGITLGCFAGFSWCVQVVRDLARRGEIIVGENSIWHTQKPSNN